MFPLSREQSAYSSLQRSRPNDDQMDPRSEGMPDSVASTPLVNPAFTTKSSTRHCARRSTRPYVSELPPSDNDASDRFRSHAHGIPVSGVRKDKVASESPGRFVPRSPVRIARPRLSVQN